MKYKRFFKNYHVDGHPISDHLLSRDLTKDEAIEEMNKMAHAILSLASFLNDDALAASYQTLGQYRTAAIMKLGGSD